MRHGTTPGRMLAATLGVALLLPLAAGCAGRRKEAQSEAELLTAEALYRKGLTALEARELRQARGYLERIQFTAQNRPELEPLVRLALADATFYAGDDLSLIEARSKYLDFVTLYGDHPMAGYAQFQAGVCSLKQVNDASRDQSQTHAAIADLGEVGRRWPASPFAEAAAQMLRIARDNLAEHEYVVARFYFKNKAWPAASERLRRLLDQYPQYARKDEVYLLLGQSLIQGNSTVEGRVYLDKLVADYPDSEAAKEARKVLAGLAEQDGGGASKAGRTGAGGTLPAGSVPASEGRGRAVPRS